MMRSHITDCGIPGVGVVPYGMHMCHFYTSRRDLVDALLPYFVAGLNHKERAIWIASPLLPVAEIAIAISEYPELERGVASGQLRICDAAEWYDGSAAPKTDDIVRRWIDEEERALADGYQGLRIGDDATCMVRKGWSRVLDYETRLHAGLRGRRIVACCNYCSQERQPVDMLEVVRCHDVALDRNGQHWHVSLTSSNARSKNLVATQQGQLARACG